jgi:glycosyltransferase involved in cell wall biosynthesis
MYPVYVGVLALGVYQLSKIVVHGAVNECLKTLHSPPPYEVNGPLVSVCIPTFMEEKFLPNCLTSLTNQTYKNVEIIIGDYASTDRTREIALSFGAKIVDVPERGIGLARNMAAQKAKGEIILNTDADVIFPADFIEKCVEYLETCQAVDCVHTGTLLYEGPIVWKLMYFWTSLLRPSWQTLGRNTFVRKHAFWSIGGYDETAGGRPGHPFKFEDIDLGRRLFLTGHRIAYLPNIFVATSARRIKFMGWTIKDLEKGPLAFPAVRNGVYV